MAHAILEKLERAGTFPPDELDQLRQLAEQFPDPKVFATELVRSGKLTRWQAGQLVLGRNIVLGKYLLIDVLSPDEVNPLFLAQHRAMERRVVLRVLAKTLSQAETWRNRFLQEAQLWAGLDHPRLVRAFNAEQDAGRYFLVLEFVDGENLEQLVQNSGPLPAEALTQLAYEVADGLQALHEKGIVFGALRPTKVMITLEGAVKLLDRGFSLWLSEAQGTEALNLKAEAKEAIWLAPELRSGDRPTRQSDLFSLGMCLLFAALGKVPRPPEDGHAALEWHQSWKAELDNLPEELIELLSRLVDPRADHRPETAGQIVEQLQPLVVVTSSLGVHEEEGEHEVMTTVQQESPVSVEVSAEHEVENKVGASETTAEDETTAPTLEEVVLVPPTVAARTGKSRATRPSWTQFFAKWHGLSPRQKLIFGAAGVGVVLGVVLVGLGAWRALETRQAPRGRASAPDETILLAAKSRRSPDRLTFAEVPPEMKFDPTVFDTAPQAESAPSPPLDASPPQETPPQPEERQVATTASDLQDINGITVKTEGDHSELSMEASDSQPPSQSPETPEAVAAPPDAPTISQKGELPATAAATGTEASKAKTENPFEHFPEAVELPEFIRPDSKEEFPPFQIGRIGGDPQAPWQLLLLGGDQAFRKGWTFVLWEAIATESEPSWIVELKTQVSGKPQTFPVAKFWREGSQLYFQWDSGAPYPQANHLRNCLLQIRVGSTSRVIRLREIVRAELPPLDLDRGSLIANIPVKWLPEEQFLLWEIVGLEGFAGDVQSQEKLPAPPHGLYELAVVRKDRDGNTQRALPMRLAFTSRTNAVNLRLTFDANIFRNIPRTPQAFSITRTNIEEERKAIEKKINPPDKKQAPRGAELQKLLAQLRELEAQLWYREFFEKAHRKARLRLRIFSQIGGEKLILVEM